MTEDAEQQAGDEGADDAAESETRTASVSNWRATAQRLEPMARRMASSLLRSAARAAKMPARLAHAASRTSTARSVMPSSAFFVGSLLLPAGPGLCSGQGETFVVRVLFCQLPRNGSHVLRCLLLRNARLEPAEDGEFTVTAPVEVIPAGDLLRVDDRNPVVGPEEVIGTVKVLRRDADNGEGMLIQKNDLADDVRACG